jgi:GTP-binding protein
VKTPEIEVDPLLEMGRRLFAQPCTFIKGAVKMDQLPPMAGLEIAFAGRSNAGKSSLLNALTNRNKLAKVSNTPGRTQEINFFDLDGKLGLVDLPGYGFAQAPEAKVKAWTRLIKSYLKGRSNLARVFVMIDSRHGLKNTDTEVLDELDKAAVSYQIVLTKGDQLKPDEQEARIAETLQGLLRRPAAFPQVLLTSSRTGEGIPDLRIAIVRLMSELGAQPLF